MSRHEYARELRGRDVATLRSQLTRAVDSIVANIVEGCGASTPREFARFLEISIKSASEAEAHLESARDRRVLDDKRWHRFSDETVSIRRMTYAYRKQVLKDAS